ncbi:hypothetical protein Rsub_04497 [Raphidocelis subcapitata]|uniref:SET domain-containing protein n=1 Tax=Raphidocelis subcapitata TaxID=307507 RepID=A0A2V0P2S8_9CHLO|nr:hypothetical protein Rsub_04497 [Raphidocelis subcapitata]|eukprot:GBF92150.1 hypothetical protein Rsub_04497 [Raphidocelis subcapitata]
MHASRSSCARPSAPRLRVGDRGRPPCRRRCPPPAAAAVPARGGPAAAPAGNSQQSALLALTQWALAGGAKYVPGLRPAQLPGGGRGIVTTFPITPGAALVSVPPALALSSAAPPPPGTPAAVWGAAPWQARLAALLLAERAAGASSRLAPFVAALPGAGDVGLPATWPEEELPQLQVPAAVRAAGEQRREWEAWHARLGPHLPPACASRDDFFWAMSCVRSRSFEAPPLPLPLSRIAAAAAAAQAAVAAAAVGGGAGAAAGAEALVLAAAGGAAAWAASAARGGGGGGGGGGADGSGGGTRVMCPLIDIFNHSAATDSCCELDTWSGELRVYAREAVAAGAEVFLNYGVTSNDQLLLLYGFVDESAADDKYPLEGPAQKAAEWRRQQEGQQEGEQEGADGGERLAVPQVSLGRRGLPASEGRALAALAGNAPPAAAAAAGDGWVQYTSLPSGARALLAAAVRRESQLLGSSLGDDEALLSAWEKLPDARASAEAQRARAAEAEARAAAAEAALGRARAAAGAEAELSAVISAPEAAAAEAAEAERGAHAAGAGVAVADAAMDAGAQSSGGGELEALALAAASARAAAASEAGRLAAAESEAAALAAAVAGLRPVAVRYRAAKKRVLAEALSQLEA